MHSYTADVFSGGGAKGISQIPYLIKAEKDSHGIPYCKTRDLLSGSSVGAINASLMASGKISASDLGDIYKELTTKIFTKRPWWEFYKTPLYDKQHFIDLWASIVDKDFLMGDCVTKLMITAVDVVEDEWGCDRNVFFKSWQEDDGNRKLVDIVVNSFSAPLYFGFTCRPEERRVYGDGGIGINNLPLDETRLEADLMGWASNENHLMLNAIGCLYSLDDKNTFDVVCQQNTLKQLSAFLNIGAGGMARSMSISDQLRKTSYICSHKPNISFRYWDNEITKKENAIDKIQYFDLYKSKGEEMAQKPLISIN